MLRTLSVCLLLTTSLAAAPPFDWTSRSGDVTREVNAGRVGDVLAVAPGRLVLTGSVTLTRAEVERGRLKLTLAVEQPEQNIRIEDLIGATGSYQPMEWKSREIRVEKAVHPERFVRGGVLTLTIDASRRPANGPAEVSKPRDEPFARLAAALSVDYTISGRELKRDPETRKREVIDAARRYPAPELQTAVGKLTAPKSGPRPDPRTLRAELLANAARLESRTLGFGTKIGESDGRPIFARGDEPDPAARREAAELRRAAALSDDKLLEWASRGKLDSTAWEFNQLAYQARDRILADAAKVAGPKADKPPVELLRPDPLILRLRNTSTVRLTDVVIDLQVGLTRSDKVRVYNFQSMLFHIPVWKPGEEVEFPIIKGQERVFQASADVFANELSAKEIVFTLPDPRKAPDQSKGAVVVTLRGPVALNESAWVEVDGKRTAWKVGELGVRVPVEPGPHKVVVRSQVRPGAVRTLHDKTIQVDAREDAEVHVRER